MKCNYICKIAFSYLKRNSSSDLNAAKKWIVIQNKIRHTNDVKTLLGTPLHIFMLFKVLAIFSVLGYVLVCPTRSLLYDYQNSYESCVVSMASLKPATSKSFINFVCSTTIGEVLDASTIVSTPTTITTVNIECYHCDVNCYVQWCSHMQI